jgi:hypothetical protein
MFRASFLIGATATSPLECFTGGELLTTGGKISNDCCWELGFLREYKEWIGCEGGDSYLSLFSLGFRIKDESVEPSLDNMSFPMSYRLDGPDSERERPQSSDSG